MLLIILSDLPYGHEVRFRFTGKMRGNIGVTDYLLKDQMARSPGSDQQVETGGFDFNFLNLKI